MGNPWYRAWVGLVGDPKIAEAAVISGEPRCLVIAVWHAILENASEVDNRGQFSTTPRRIAAILCEPATRIEAAFEALTELGMIGDGVVVAWEKRQPPSESRAEAAERQRQSRARRGGRQEELPPDDARHNLSQRVTPPESESDTDSSSSSSRGRAGAKLPEIDLATARPLPTKSTLEAEARLLMGDAPVVVDADFSPISALLEEPNVTRGDVLAGLTEARDAPNFRPVSWRQCAGWVRKAAKNRLAAAAELRGGRGPPGRGSRRQSDLSVCLEIARGESDYEAASAEGFGARAGPVHDGRAVAL